MKRIDSINARANLNGTAKNGFHDNADLPGQDATYLTPGWCNTIQEELANSIEGMGQQLNPANNAQLLSILQSLSSKITTLENQLDSLETDLSNIEDTAIGDLYITTRNFTNASAVATHKGFGIWERFGQGRTLISHDVDVNLDELTFPKILGATGGQNFTALEVRHVPSHVHEFVTTWAGQSGYPGDATRIGDSGGHANDEVTDSLISQQTSAVGAGHDFSVVQASIVVAMWKRIA